MKAEIPPHLSVHFATLQHADGKHTPAIYVVMGERTIEFKADHTCDTEAECLELMDFIVNLFSNLDKGTFNEPIYS